MSDRVHERLGQVVTREWLTAAPNRDAVIGHCCIDYGGEIGEELIAWCIKLPNSCTQDSSQERMQVGTLLLWRFGPSSTAATAFFAIAIATKSKNGFCGGQELRDRWGLHVKFLLGLGKQKSELLFVGHSIMFRVFLNAPNIYG